MIAEISFDTEVGESGRPHVEGCYRLAGDIWRPFYFTQRWVGGPNERYEWISTTSEFGSGIIGVTSNFSKEKPLTKNAVKNALTEAFGVDFVEVRGPDSLQLK